MYLIKIYALDILVLYTSVARSMIKDGADVESLVIELCWTAETWIEILIFILCSL